MRPAASMNQMTTPDSAPTEVPRRARRAPDPDERLRDPARTRQLILDAALAQFSEKGYAGARVREIADQAGVNTQLISYYFGGKEGLYHELMAFWHRQEATMAQEDASFADTIVSYLHAFAARPELLRMFAWEGLTRQSDPRPPDTEPGEGEAPEVTDIRRRQAAGEIADDLDPAFLLVFLMGAAMGVATIPRRIEELCGIPVDSEEFVSRCERQVRLILAHLAGSVARRPDEPGIEAGNGRAE
jgi:TetR/AcrR family transcriptional regulator